MLNTPAKFTRLELAIIVAAMVVLVFSNRPPESGNAGIHETPEPMTNVQMPVTAAQPENPLPDMIQPETAASDSVKSDNSPIAPLHQPRPQARRMAMIDARKWNSLKYPNIMYGEVTASRVWNGTTFEWRPVCKVKEKDGTISIWNLDDRHEGVIIKELPPDPDATY